MGNCCAVPATSDSETKGGKNKPNPFSVDYVHTAGNGFESCVGKPNRQQGMRLRKDVNWVVSSVEANSGLLMCTDKSTGEVLACKSISKKLRTRVDIEDVRREVDIMKHMPNHTNIVSLKDTYEDNDAVHLVMELCAGGELFDRIVARGHYTERAAAGVKNYC